MKRWGLSLLILAFSIVIGTVLANYLLNREPSAKSSRAKQQKEQAEKFIWGVQGGAYMLNQLVDTYHPENVDLQIQKTRELGAGAIRANLEMGVGGNPFKASFAETTNDDFVDRVTSKGLDIIYVLDPDIPKTIGKIDYQAEGYKIGSYAAERYKGKVKYYQLANEVTGTIVKPSDYEGETFPGENNIEYSKERFDATLGWIKGMAKGIRENDPDAKLIISGHWILYDIIGKLIEGGADFDIIGWAWYSEDGLDVTSREYNYGQRLNLAEKLASYKKDLWIIECNRDAGSYAEDPELDGENEQAQFFAQILPNIYNSKYFKGLIVFTLFDDRVAEKGRDKHLGIVEVDYINAVNVVKKNKKAFDIIKEFILTHPKIPSAQVSPTGLAK